jgi:DNA-binding HxlR family transcriptional regulator
MQVTRYDIVGQDASAVADVAYHGAMTPSREPRGAAASPLAAALDRVGDRWSPQIVEVLLGGPRRNADIQAEVAGIAPNILADRLRRLEADGLIAATAYSERPPRFDYRLTAEGRALAGALRLLADWGASHAGGGRDGHEVLRHDACGTALEARWFCPTCGDVVDTATTERGQRL